MKLTLTFEFEDAVAIMDESTQFRRIVAWNLSELQSGSSKLSDLSDLRKYVRAKFRDDELIPAIKYVRQWSVDNKNNIGYDDFESINCLAAAKKFVEKAFGKC